MWKTEIRCGKRRSGVENGGTPWGSSSLMHGSIRSYLIHTLFHTRHQACQKESHRFEPFLDLDLPIPTPSSKSAKSVTLQVCVCVCECGGGGECGWVGGPDHKGWGGTLLTRSLNRDINGAWPDMAGGRPLPHLPHLAHLAHLAPSQDCLLAFTMTESLEGVQCDGCKKCGPHTKSLQIYRLPPVLVLTLKRFTRREVRARRR